MAIKPETVPYHTHESEDESGDINPTVPPAAHASTHAIAGSDVLTPAAIGASDLAHHARHETSGADALAHLSAGIIDSGTLDGDRLPAISTTKKGGVPAVTPATPGEFLRDTGDFEHILQANCGGLETTATPQFAGLGIKTAGSDNHVNLVEGTVIGIAGGPIQTFRDADKKLELTGGDVKIGSTATRPGTGGTWSTYYDSTELYMACSIVWNGHLYFASGWGAHKLYRDGVLVYTGATGFYCFAIHGSKLFAGGSSGEVFVTSDGITWAATAGNLTGIIDSVQSMLSSGGLLWATGDPHGKVYTSADDGATWIASLNLSLSSEGHGLIESSIDGYIYAGLGKYIYQWDGATWAVVYTGAVGLTFNCSLVWNNKLYFGASDAAVYYSADGATWSSVATGGSGNVYALIERDAKLLAAVTATIYHSSDGLIWTSFYGCAEVVVYSMTLLGNDLYITTGTAGKVLAYTDNTYVPANNLELMGHYTMWGQFRPGDAPGVAGNLLISGGVDYSKWLGNGMSDQYLQGGDTPAWAGFAAAALAAFKSTIASKIVCNNGEVIVCDGEVVYGT